MNFPLSFWDIGLLLSVNAIILIVTSALLSENVGKINILISKKKLKNASMFMSTLFLIILAIKILENLVFG
jgi:hypothetical protein